MTKRITALLLVAASGAICQQPAQQVPPPPVVPGQPSNAPANAPRPKDTLAVNDQLIISARDVQGIGDRPFRIEADGTVTLPLVGKVRAEGFTVEQFEKEVTAQLGQYVRSPQVSVKRLATRADTVVVAGAFKSPGVYALPERRTLLEVIAAVGGLESNVRTIRITRQLDGGHSPLPSGLEDAASGVSTATVNLSRLMENPSMREALVLERDDALFAASAGPVFLTGEVLKPGAFDLAEGNSLGMMELISMAGGLTRDAAPEKTKILRPILNGTKRAEIPVNVKDILEGRFTDFRLLPNDMVVVPRGHGTARVVGRVVLIVVPVLVSTLIYLAVR